VLKHFQARMPYGLVLRARRRPRRNIRPSTFLSEPRFGGVFVFEKHTSNSDYSTRVIPPFRRDSLCVTDAHFDLECELAEVREA
jgi:hypothetical protein